MVAAIIGILFILDPMSGQSVTYNHAFETMAECEAVSIQAVRDVKDQGYDAAYVCGELKTVYDGEA